MIDDQPITVDSGGAPLDSPLIYNPSRRYEVWRFLTYMLLHSGLVVTFETSTLSRFHVYNLFIRNRRSFSYFHIIFNLGVQLVLGIPLEMVHKGVRVGIVYILGVIGGLWSHITSQQ